MTSALSSPLSLLLLLLLSFLYCAHAQCPTDILVKESVTSVSTEFLQNVTLALKKMKTVPSAYNDTMNAYDYFVWLHINAVDPTTRIHGYVLFLPWHREMVYRMDKEIQRVSGNPKLYFPYWDFFQPSSTNRMFSNDFMGPIRGNPDNFWAVESGPFAGSAQFPVDPVLSQSRIPSEILEQRLARTGGNGLMACLEKYESPLSLPFLLDSTLTSQAFVSNTTHLWGPFGGLDSEGFYRLDSNSTNCRWEDESCLWYFVNEDSRLICKHYGSSLPDPSTSKCLATALSLGPTDSNNPGSPNTYFRPCLEGVDPADSYSFPWEALGVSLHPPHGQAHAYVGGSAAQPGSSNDPAFFGIHNNVDRLWAEWESENDNYFMEFTEEQLLLPLPLFPGRLVRDVADTREMGYTFDSVCSSAKAIPSLLVVIGALWSFFFAL